LKSGFLKFDDFRKFIDDNPHIRSIELSIWGESLLNPQLLQMLEYAHARRVELSLANGANLNTVKPDVLEGVVKYQLRAITYSIDGASAETYPLYRVRGDFDRVIGNIERINEFKRQYHSPYPRLTWQFVAFGHNAHEIEQARAMAARLDMRFALKLDWENLYDTTTFSPIRDHDLIAKESRVGRRDACGVSGKIRPALCRQGAMRGDVDCAANQIRRPRAWLLRQLLGRLR
jgi:MoaA/NifB/PqqE/SkfB family radical SAM enzyme